MAAPEYIGLIRAVRVDGVDAVVASARYIEDDTGGTVYLRVATDAPKPTHGIELVDDQGRVLLSAPDVNDEVGAGGEFLIRFGAPLEGTFQAVEPAPQPAPEPAPTEATTPASGKAGTKGE